MLTRIDNGPVMDSGFVEVAVRRLRESGAPPLTSVSAVLDQLIAECQSGGGPEVEFYDDIPLAGLPPELQMIVFAVVQELLANACRHSQSANVLVGLAQDDERICIQVQDWGVGFVPEHISPRRSGLKGIGDLVKWSGGTMIIDSGPAAGTCVVVEIPLAPETEPGTEIHRASMCRFWFNAKTGIRSESGQGTAWIGLRWP